MLEFANTPGRGRLRMGLLAALLAVTLAPAAQAAGSVTVRIDNFTFGPETITVTPGTEVTWINGDDIPHTVVAQDKSFRSKTLDTDDSYAHVFSAVGEYSYFCSLHPHMTGKIVVKPSDR